MGNLFKLNFILLILGISLPLTPIERGRLRDFGIKIGVMMPGKLNALTDVAGVRVGQVTLNKEDGIRTGVTVIMPHAGNLFQQKVPAALYVGNGFGKFVGSTQIVELGNIESPIVLTNTLSVPEAMAALIEYTLMRPGNEEVRSVNAVVGETNDGFLNDIRARQVKKEDVFKAIDSATDGPVQEGNVGAGTGTVCFGFKGGIGTSSRILPQSLGGYTVGVLVQTNFGGILRINGLPVGEILKLYYLQQELEMNSADGSCMIVIATDAPLLSRNLERLAKRAMLGLARTGGIAANSSGDYAVAFSTAEKLRIRSSIKYGMNSGQELINEAMSPLFLAVIEATEEAILNSLFQASDMIGINGHKIEALPIGRLLPFLHKTHN